MVKQLMPIAPFTEQDFAVFHIDGLEARMEEIRKQIRPKFEQMGAQISPFLDLLLEEPMFMHIAKHARRTVNPPEETWVAWSSNKRGYKAHPHFQLGIRDTHLFIWFALIYENKRKPAFARNLRQQLGEIWPAIPDQFYISEDHTVPTATLKKEWDTDKGLERLEKVKKAEFLCGMLVSRQEAIQLSGEELVKRTESTFQTLRPLYRLAVSS